MESINYGPELNPILKQQVQYTPSHPTALLSISIFEQHNNNKYIKHSQHTANSLKVYTCSSNPLPSATSKRPASILQCLSPNNIHPFQNMILCITVQQFILHRRLFMNKNM